MISSIKRHLTVAVSIGVFASNVLAQQNNDSLVPLPSTTDYSTKDGWAGALGLKLQGLAAYKGSDHGTLQLVLDGAVQWRKGDHLLFWDGFDLNDTELGWRGLLQDTWLMEVGARHEIVIPSSASEKADIENLPHRGSHVLGFVQTKHAVGTGWKSWVSGRISGGPSNYGWLAKLSAGHHFGQQYNNTGTELLVFTTFGNEKNINNYFGISEDDANASGFEEANLDGGYRSSGFTLIYRKNLKSNVQIAAKAGIEFYNTDFKKSEIVRDTSQTSTELAVLWRF